jgi:hypothetical protein
MSELLDTVVEFLHSDGWPVAVRTDIGEVVATKYEGRSGIWICEGRIDAYERFVFYSVSPVAVPEPRRSAVAEYAARVNFGLVVGSLELDLEDGTVRMKTSIDVEGDRLSPALVRNLIYANVRTLDVYAPGLLLVIQADASPAEALAQVVT